jgi:serine/threonine protein kinase
MEKANAPAPHPALLPPGTVVGPWRVLGWGGRGVYGAVYRAVRAEVEDEQAHLVALKVALLPRDPRFAREVELLERLRHPSIPRLVDSGEWQHPSGTVHPYIVMEWIDGTPLYEWARQHSPASQQILGLLAQLASALRAVHTQGAVHRDVKGDNVMVRRADERAVLTDFGSGLPSDAALLTPQSLIPGTPAYHSPEAELFPLRFGRDPTARYSAGPADDLYALGVTAYRLVTGQYPQPGEPFKDEAGIWQPGELGSPPPHVLNPQVEPCLSALILRMLSARPEERGTAEQLAEALEQAARNLAPESTQPLFDRNAVPPSAKPSEEFVAASALGDHTRLSNKFDVRVPEPRELSAEARGSTQSNNPLLSTRQWWPWLTLAAAGLTLVVWAWWAVPGKSVAPPLVVQKEAGGAGQQDGGTTGLGDSTSAASTEDSSDHFILSGMVAEPLPEPLPGQTRPDANGRCPRKRQVALNGGCWLEILLDHDGCEELNGQMFKGTCYVPFVPPGHQSTSSPTHKP